MPLNLNPTPEPEPPEALAVEVSVGGGKTGAALREVVVPLVEAGHHPVIAMPRHRLGDQIVADLADLGIDALVVRGREAIDPEAEQPLGNSKIRMCQNLTAAKAVQDALADVSPLACENKDKRCQFFDTCGYQRQRRRKPQVHLVPFQLLARQRPAFIPPPQALLMDEEFYGAFLRGLEPHPYQVFLRDLIEGDRNVPGRPWDTADLRQISAKVVEALADHPDDGQRLLRETLVLAGITAEELNVARKLEWDRKRAIKDVYPGLAAAEVEARCAPPRAIHNKEVARNAQLFELLALTLERTDIVRSPWIQVVQDRPSSDSTRTEKALRLSWSKGIHQSWEARTLIMNAAMEPSIVQRFFGCATFPEPVTMPAPHARIRQVRDLPFTADMLVPDEGATGETRQHRNVEKLRHFIETRASDVRPGRALVICQEGVEVALKRGRLPVEVSHFNAISGLNDWNDVALLIVIGRTLPPARTIERIAAALFDADVEQIPADDRGNSRYPMVKKGLRLRDGGVVGVKGPQHPDPRVESIRWAICEAELVQAVGRARAINRTARNPVQIDVLCNVVLPIEVHQALTWSEIQPGDAEIMRAAGVVPLFYEDMVRAYPHLFETPEAARKALDRAKPGQTSIRLYLIAVCPGFALARYRHPSARRSHELLFDPARVDPAEWLKQNLGPAVELLEVKAAPPESDETATGPDDWADAADQVDGEVDEFGAGCSLTAAGCEQDNTVALDAAAETDELVQSNRHPPDTRAVDQLTVAPASAPVDVAWQAAPGFITKTEPEFELAPDPNLSSEICEWFVMDERQLVHCGKPNAPGADLCPDHLVQRARTMGSGLAAVVFLPPFPTANSNEPGTPQRQNPRF